MSNKVYIFGAGASVHIGGLLTRDFILSGINILCDKSYDLSEEIQESFYKVAFLIDTLYKTNIVNEIEDAKKNNCINITDNSSFALSNLSIEELLSYVDLCITNNDTWLDFKKITKSTI